MPNFFSIRRDRTHFFDFGFCAFEILDKMCFWDFKLFGLRIFVSNRKQISRDDGDPWLESLVENHHVGVFSDVGYTTTGK